MPAITDPDPSTLTMPLLAEALVVARRRTHRTVRVTTITHEHEQFVDEVLTHERVEIERVPIGRTVEAVPPIREEGDTTILPVVVEVVVVERRLVLKEEVRIRRLRSTERHQQVVTLRTQDAVITRTEAAPQPAGDVRPALGGTAGGTTAAPAREPGFWSNLFGGESADSAVYDRSVASGSTVVTVKVPGQHKSRVVEILERYDPIDFDDRAASYGTTQTTTTTTTAAAPAMVALTKAPLPKAAAPQAAARPVATAAGDETIKVMEERLTVGKRAVNNGGARVRSYVVETPVEEQVSLHSETVRIERRPVADGRVVTEADFGERSVEMHAVSEEAVVGKEARVVEEISLRKEASDRVETVRDTVRSTKVDVEQAPAVETTTTTTTAATKLAAAPPMPAAPVNPKR